MIILLFHEEQQTLDHSIGTMPPMLIPATGSDSESVLWISREANETMSQTQLLMWCDNHEEKKLELSCWRIDGEVRFQETSQNKGFSVSC
jgi:hypothetical protein